MSLKAQDVYVILKIIAAGTRRPPYASLAVDLGMSASEVHASVKRAKTARLLHGPESGDGPNLTAIEEFLIHGLKYVFPAERGNFTRGVPTSYAADPLRARIPPSTDPIPVWPHPDGKDRGVALPPLHKSAPVAALRDHQFYEYLALADALRDGRARERKYAEEELRQRLQAAR